MSAFLKAKKIWIDTELRLNVYADFVEKFSLESTDNTKLYITADTGYIAYINGKVIDSFQFADLECFKVYDKLDISKFVKKGENTLHIIGYSQGDSSFTYKLGDAGLIFEVRQGETVFAYSCRDTLCRINPNYQSGEVERLTWQESFSFRYNAEGDDIGYKNAIEKEGYAKLYERPVKQLEVRDRRSSKILASGYYFAPEDKSLPSGEYMKQTALVTLSEVEMGYDISKKMLPNNKGLRLSCDKGDGIFILVDLLGETAGYLDLEFELPHDAEVHIGFGEHINSLRVRTSIDGRQFAAVYKAKKGVNKFTHRMKRFAGRYIELHVPAKSVKLNYIGLKPTEYPLSEKKDIEPRDLLHKKIFEVAKRTLTLCMHEHFEDCPWREQALYAMDGRIEMLSAYYAFGELDFTRASLSLFAASQRENGQIELCAPADSPIYIPSFTLCFVIAVAEYLENSNDKAFAEKIYPVLKRLMDSYTAKMTDRGLIASFTEPEAWNFYEWSAGLDGRVKELWPADFDFDCVNEAEGKSLSAPLNAYYSMALSSYADILTAIGREAEATDAVSIRNKVNKALHGTFWDEDKKLFASYITEGKLSHFAELTQCLMVVSGASDDDKTARIREILMSDNDLIKITMGSTIHKYDTILTDEANIDFVFSDIAKRFGDMLFAGATSFWETYDGDDEFTFGGATSLCHGWASLPIHYYHRYKNKV